MAFRFTRRGLLGALMGAALGWLGSKAAQAEPAPAPPPAPPPPPAAPAIHGACYSTGGVTTYTYDAARGLVPSSYPVGATVTYTYDARGGPPAPC